MKKIIFAALAITVVGIAFAQTSKMSRTNVRARGVETKDSSIAIRARLDSNAVVPEKHIDSDSKK